MLEKYGLTEQDFKEFQITNPVKLDPIIRDGVDITDAVVYFVSGQLPAVREDRGYYSRVAGGDEYLQNKITVATINDLFDTLGISKDRREDVIKKAAQTRVANTPFTFYSGNNVIQYSDTTLDEIKPLIEYINNPTPFYSIKDIQKQDGQKYKGTFSEFLKVYDTPFTLSEKNKLLGAYNQEGEWSYSSPSVIDDKGHLAYPRANADRTPEQLNRAEKLTPQVKELFGGDIPEGMASDFAYLLSQQGITNIKNVKAFAKADGDKFSVVLYDKNTGLQFSEITSDNYALSNFERVSDRETYTYDIFLQPDGTFKGSKTYNKMPNDSGWV